MSAPLKAPPSPFERSLPAALLAMTAVTGLVDAVSFLGLGRVFTANMTGNVVFIAFALAGVPELSVPRSLTALAAFMAGAIVGGRLMSQPRADAPAGPARIGFALEVALLVAAALAASGFGAGPSVRAGEVYALIVLTALAMGIRNAIVRKLAVPDLTTTVLTLTITGLAADSPLAGGTGPRWQRRVGSVVAMLVGAGAGALLVRRSLALTLGVAAAASAASTLALRRNREGAAAVTKQ
jgi:uncharacterized membrane protein YoaK (UPF0700 family)